MVEKMYSCNCDLFHFILFYFFSCFTVGLDIYAICFIHDLGAIINVTDAHNYNDILISSCLPF